MKKKLKSLQFIWNVERIPNFKLNIFYLFLLTIIWSCKKEDVDSVNDINPNSSNIFLKHNNPLSPSVNLVLNDVKLKMNDEQISQFINKAGLIIWDKAKAYTTPPTFMHKANRRQQNTADSIVVLPVAFPNANNINAALVAQIYNNGDSIIYSTHFKNHFSSINSTLLPDYNITARELYVLGMAQLDEEVFSHKKFIITGESLDFGAPVNPMSKGTSFASLSLIIPTMCEYSFTYSSAVVFPPVTVWSYTALCGSPILSPPIVFLQGLDESYGFVNYSSTPVGEGGGSGPASPYALEFSTFYNSLNASQQSFLDNVEYNEYYHGFIDYLILQQFSQQAKDKIIWSINYLSSPTTLITTWDDFRSTYLNDFPSLSFLSQDDINWLNNYPYLKSRIYYYLQNNMILNAEQKVQFHINKMRTESSYFTFNTAYSTYSHYKDLWFNDYSYLFKLGGKTFGDQAINYLMQHPSVPIETFQNQFMGTPEGADGEYDSNYWDDPNLSFPPQNLPTWADFEATFPSHDDPNYDSPDKMYTSIGGSVYTNGYKGPESNTCAIRLSKALNYSGVTIPSIPGSTFKGADNKYYFLGAAKMIVWMKKTFGTNTNPNYSHYTNADGGTNGFNFPTAIGSKKGIFGLLPKVAYPPTNNPTQPAFNATGHVDLINNTTPTTNINSVCDGKCYFNATGGVKEINIWTLN